MVRNNRSVRGPRSALTSFLEERGIRNTNPAPTAQRNRNGSESTTTEIQQNNREATIVEGDEEEANQETAEVFVIANPGVQEVEAEPSGVVTESRARQTTDDIIIEGPSTSNRRPKRNLKKKKKANSDDDDDEYIPDLIPGGDDPKAKFSTKKKPNRNEDRDFEGVTFCANCQKRFVVTQACRRDNGSIFCESCTKNPKNGEKNKINKMNAKQTKKRRRNNALTGGINFFDKDELPTLMSVCIQIISDNIDDVDSFGGISSSSLVQISRILSKHRRLDDLTLPLFLSSNPSIIHLYDTAKLNENSLLKIADLGAEVHDLKLQFCGRMNDEILSTYASSFTNLTSFTLHGSFLVTETGFSTFFGKLGSKLNHLSIHFAPKFSLNAMKSVVDNCKELKSLSLSSCSKLTDECISLLVYKDEISTENSKMLPSLPNLEKLDFSDSGELCSDESLILTLPIIGKKLTTLNLSGWKNLSDDAIICGIKEHCTNLGDLNLAKAEKLTSEGIVNLLTGLYVLNLSNCSILLNDTVVECLFKYHHFSIKHLYLNGLDGLTSNGLKNAINTYKPRLLTTLNASWVRAISDPLLEGVFPNLNSLKDLTVWGCHQVTESLTVPIAMENSKFRIIGRECDTL
ncbi:RNI-like protein [Neoconidiobolus thromboides FSU 785]|nr:RNI-like protein [Neoconidiobolus thromboides FSU 785]